VEKGSGLTMKNKLYQRMLQKMVADVYIKITDPTPFPVDQEDRVKKDTLSFGSLDALNLDGNWRE